MNWLKKNIDAAAPPASPPVLHLSGEALDSARRNLEEGAAGFGGIDSLLNAVATKAALFHDRLSLQNLPQ